MRWCVFLMTWLLFSAQAWPYKLEVGSYSVGGSPADDRTINLSDATLTPVMLGIKCASAAHPVWATTDTVANTLYWGTASNQVNNRIQALGLGTFQLGTGAEVQPASTTCYYVAFGSDANNDIAVGTYTGNGVDDRAITISPAFLPAFVLVRHTTGGSTVAAWRSAAHAGDLTGLISGSNTTNAIQSLGASGFTVGTHASVNSDTIVYAYLAVKAVASYNDSGSYTGNATDDQTVATIATPTFSLFKVAGSGAVACSRFGTGGDNSWLMNNSAEAANQIQAYNASGIQIGSATCVNQNSTLIHWWASKNPVYAAAAKVRRVIVGP